VSELDTVIPRSQLRVKETLVARSRFPVIDAHNHLGEEFGGGWCNRSVAELLAVLDEANVRRLVDLDGGWGEKILRQRLDKFKSAAPERFSVFGGVDWSAWEKYGHSFGEWAARRLRIQVEHGAQGLKIWKNFGLNVRDQAGRLVPVDDSRLDVLWATAGELGIPVLIHVADPVAFFDPLDLHNERREELNAHPDWHFPSPHFPSFMTIMDQLASLIKRHTGTIFIGAHVGCYAENLAWVEDILDACSNYYLDIAARIAELGRQPYTTRRFFIKHQDRILFGTDIPPQLAWYRLYYRFLETDDEYFNYDLSDPPTQGRWRIYGLHLPDEVLEKGYSLNAQKLIK
jgi:predicted TIM-barrel fold metal-dependent hydrolase